MNKVGDPRTNSHDRVGVGTRTRAGRPSAAAEIRRRIERGGEDFWTARDFSGVSPATAARTLARLAEEGVVERARKGLYYRSRKTIVGQSVPSASAIAELVTSAPLHPAGLTAGTLLGFSTQQPVVREFATPAANPPTAIPRARIHVRRPPARASLNEREGALLEFLRERARHSDLDPRQTRQRLLHLLSKDRIFERLVRASLDEPPRVRAMLGALGEELGADEHLLRRLRRSLNPLSKFDFGPLRNSPHAKRWQAL